MYNYPVTMGEAFIIAAVRDRKPIWEISGIESQIFTPRLIPDNVARALVFEAKPFDALKDGGGKDMFSIDWEYIPVAGGSNGSVPASPSWMT